MYLGAIHNCQLLNQCLQAIFWGGGCQLKKNINSVHFEHYNPFFFLSLSQLIFHSEKLYVLYNCTLTVMDSPLQTLEANEDANNTKNIKCEYFCNK